MLSGKGYFKGSSILVTGTAGTGKSSMAALFIDAACRRGERCIYFAFEEAENQIIRNMLSIGIDLQQWVKKDLLRFQTSNPIMYGLEMHLVAMHKVINEFQPVITVIDPISNLVAAATEGEVKSMFSRLVIFLKSKQITSFCTDLTSPGGPGSSLEQTGMGVSSLMDTWLLLATLEVNGERNRCLYVLKSRGMAHSNQIREFVLSDDGIQLQDVYIGSSGVLTGSARITQEALDQADTLTRKQEIEKRQRDIERMKTIAQTQKDAIDVKLKADTDEIELIIGKEKLREETIAKGHLAIAKSRQVDEPPPDLGSTGKTGKTGKGNHR
jgi:circadian clock protein KaiC